MAPGSSTRRTSSTRAKDSDRNDTCQILDTALAEGQLSMAEHGERVKAATTAATLGELQHLIADLQTAASPVQLPDLSSRRLPTMPGGWGLRAAAAGVLVVLGIAIGWGLYGNTPSPLNFTSDPGAKSDGITAKVLTPPRQLHSLGGLNGLFEQMAQKWGDTMGYSLTVYPDYASLERPDPDDERRVLRYVYRGGWGDPSSSARDDGDVLVDLSAFDVPTIVGIIRGAPETLGIKADDVDNVYLSIDPSSDQTAAPGTVDLAVYVSSEFGSGYLEMNPDGTLKYVNYPSN
ncbi:DUF1707 domain-containing protein [Mycolicibacterium hippocampi]|uniref:DUF1707 domain-containing protein n=1 Tax=Mycolicibacterium hippocampi TaxID=659824 RepID=A0A7I9ZHF7_9MYCO|nr:DUF1707 domain-containing protein [Mycolicibacterium hippocampi]GFH00452.1 hypothetical protein MHIP_09350 [Mycolicibacterium hippocampi]